MMFQKSTKILILNVGGKGLSKIAGFLLSRGVKVSGWDSNALPIIKDLRKRGLNFISSTSEIDLEHYDLIVYSIALKKTHIFDLLSLGKSTKAYSLYEFLNLISQQCNNVVAISGVCGKTTISQYVYLIFRKNNKPISIFNSLNFEFIEHDDSVPFIIEVSENENQMFSLKNVNFALVSNIENGFYRDEYLAFAETAKGAVIINSDDKSLMHFFDTKNNRWITYGFHSKSNYIAKYDNKNSSTFQVSIDFPNKECINIGYNSYNISFIQNILAAASICHLLGCNIHEIENGLLSLDSLINRFEIIKRTDAYILIRDIAHQILAIKSSILSSKKTWPARKIIVVYSPHISNESTSFHKDICDAIHADKVILLGSNDKTYMDYAASNPAWIHCQSELDSLSELKKEVSNKQGVIILMGLTFKNDYISLISNNL